MYMPNVHTHKLDFAVAHVYMIQGGPRFIYNVEHEYYSHMGWNSRNVTNLEQWLTLEF